MVELLERPVAAPPAPSPNPAVEASSPPRSPSPDDRPPPDDLPAPGRVLFTGDFEPGDLSQWWAVHRQETDRIRVVSSPVRQGRFATRHELRDGDFVANGERAELLWGSSANPTLREGEEHYIAWSTYFPQEFPDMPGRQLFMQTHPVGPGFPQIEMRCDGGRISLDLNDGVQPWSVPLERGRWHDFVLRARWSANPAQGLVEFWYDGRKVVSDLSVQTLEKPGVNSYVKLGYYRPGTSVQPPAWLFQDAMRIGTSLASVTG